MIALTPSELVELTEKVKPTAQARELEHMGIPYRRRRNGSLCVFRIHAETIEGFEGRLRRPAEPEPELVLEQ